MEQSRRSGLRRIASGVALVAALAVIGWAAIRFGGSSRAGSMDISASGPTLVVEVLNGTDRSGLARQVTHLLRDRGVDVIYFGTADPKVDSTIVLVRRGDLSRGREVARLLGVDRVASRPDPKPRVDVTVIVGPDFRFPKGWLPL